KMRSHSPNWLRLTPNSSATSSLVLSAATANTAVRRWYTRRSRVSLRRRWIALRCSGVRVIGFIANCLPCLMFQLAPSSTPRCCTRRFSFGDGIVSATPSQGTYDSTTGLWTVGDVARGQVLTLQVVALVVSPDVQTNTAAVAFANERDPDLSNNQASATETPQLADLSVTKDDGVTSVVPGGS